MAGKRKAGLGEGCLGCLVIVIAAPFLLYFGLQAIQPHLEQARQEREAREKAEEERIAAMSPEERAAHERKQRIMKGFNPWDGSHRELVRLVKEGMHDPSSFEHVETKLGETEREEVLRVRMVYRGSNAFGATVRNSITALVHIDGPILKVAQTTP